MFLELTTQFHFFYTYSIKLFRGPINRLQKQKPIRINLMKGHSEFFVNRIPTTKFPIYKEYIQCKTSLSLCHKRDNNVSFIWTAYNIPFLSIWMHMILKKQVSSLEKWSHADWSLTRALYRTAFVITGTIEVTATVNQTESISSASTWLC